MELYLPIILDGATGTRLQAAGYKGQDFQEKWIIDNPSTIIEIQRSYIDAGSRIIYVPSFQLNPIKLADAGLADKTCEYNSKLAELCRSTAATASEDKPVYVAGDIAPTGHWLRPLGDMDFDDLYKCYEEQVLALLDYVDLWVVETMMTLSDARAAVMAIKAHSTKPILVTFSCDANGRTVSGGDVCAIMICLQSMGISAFGLNCSFGPSEMLPQFERLSKYASVPLIAKPNAGLPETRDGIAVYDMSPDDFVAQVEKMCSYGVGFFGGCCGTTENHIKALCDALYDENGSAKFDIAAPILMSERFPGKLVLASERQVFVLDENADINKECIVLEIEADASNDSPKNINNVINTILEEQIMWDKPLFIKSDDAVLLEQARLAYQGLTI